jgi:hypothetical protein
MSEEHDHAACVAAWRTSLGELDAPALLRAFDRAFCAVWRRAQRTLGDVTLLAIGDRVLHDASERHPMLRDLHLELTGISSDDLLRRADELTLADVERAVCSVLVDLLAVLGRLTAGVLTPLLHAALSGDRDEGSAP